MHVCYCIIIITTYNIMNNTEKNRTEKDKTCETILNWIFMRVTVRLIEFVQ